MFRVTTPYSVSHGTMRPEDLIPSFMGELESLNDSLATSGAVGQDQLDSVCLSEQVTKLLAQVEMRCDFIDNYFESEHAGWDLESLFDMLEEFAGDGLYFGANEGDGSDYGFWVAGDAE